MKISICCEWELLLPPHRFCCLQRYNSCRIDHWISYFNCPCVTVYEGLFRFFITSMKFFTFLKLKLCMTVAVREQKIRAPVTSIGRKMVGWGIHRICYAGSQTVHWHNLVFFVLPGDWLQSETWRFSSKSYLTEGLLMGRSWKLIDSNRESYEE